MIKYVAGFLFSSDKDCVVLIKKNKPDWLKDQWTGVGGHVEDGETSLEAMIREFEEETTVKVTDWKDFCTLKGEGFVIDWFWSKDKIAFNNIDELGYEENPWPTDEQVAIWEVDGNDDIYSNNAKWLVRMAQSMEKDRASSFKIQEIY